jgi:two-component system, response regulator YesN
MKLLICDDDISTIDFIENNLNCKEFGITKLLRAYNGLTAKEIIAGEHPEIILCDIGMPQCNGIEVLKYVSESGLRPEFAFLTCYESFEYAREAVRYGATNYLTKPLDLNELREALLKMTATIRARQLAQEQKENNPHHKDIYLNNFLQRLRDGIYGTDKGKISAALQRHNMELAVDDSMRCIMVCADITDALKNGWEQELLVYSFNFLAEEVIAQRQDFAYSIVDIGERFITVTIITSAQKFSEQELMRQCNYLVSVCRSQLFIVPVCLIGKIMPLYTLPQVSAELQKRLRKIRLQSGQVHLYREAEISPENEMTPALDEMKILKYIKQHNKAGYIEEISAVANKMVLNKKDSDCGIFLLHHDLLQIFTDYLHDNSIPEHALFQNGTIRELDGNAERSIFDMMNFASRIYDYAVTQMQELSDNENVINTTKRFIAAHFRENIDRDSIAAIAYVTPNYLSKRFHFEVGMNMREYINELRIKEAKRLLVSTNSSISEIASNIGFDNISYFSTVFRKQCGISPVDWRSGNCKEETNEAERAN